MAKLSVVMVCRDERTFLDLAIRSVLPFADEVLVGDMASTDGSAALARSLGARVVEIEPRPVVELVRPDLVDLASHEWILLVDPDEIVSGELGTEISRLVRTGAHDVVDLPFRTYMTGVALRGSGWSSRIEHHVRLFRRDAVEMPALVHAPIRALGDRRLHAVHPDRGVVHHFNYRTWDQFVAKMNRYTSMEAEERVARGERQRLRHLVREVAEESYLRALREKAWRDGWRGPSLVALMWVYRGLVYIKARQLSEVGDDAAVVAGYRRRAEELLGVHDPEPEKR